MPSTESERTPLLAEQQQQQQQQQQVSNAAAGTSSKKSWKIYIVLVGIFAFLAVLSYCVRAILPAALSDQEAFATGRFPGQHAFDAYLSAYTEPRPGNSKANRASREWLLRTIREESDKHPVSVEIDEDGIPFVGDDGKGGAWMIESNNVLVKVIGTRGDEDAFMLSAHYDSVPASHGVTDDGVGIAVMLEVYRNILHFPLEHTVIFNFNNYEEVGLWGSKGMLHHPWIKDVRLFLNLEGAGAGGRALMFRASSPEALAKTAGNRILQHANVLGNDMFEMGLIKSATDYTVYLDSGIPGIDLAFYYLRSHYHTTRDTLEYITARSVQHMGDLALATTRGVANSAAILTSEQPKAKPFVYYDFLGQFALTYTLFTSQVINALVLLALPTYLTFWAVQTQRSSSDKQYASIAKRSLIGFVLVTLTLLVILAFAIAVGFILTKINPVVLYGHIEIGGVTVLSAAIFALIALQWLYSAIDNKFDGHRSALDLETSIAYGLVNLSWLLLAGATFAASVGIGSLYFVFWLYVGSVLAVALKERLSGERLESWAAACFVQVCIFYPLVFDVAFLTFDSMRHTLADGTPEIAVYVLLSAFSSLLLICLVPWVHKAGHLKRATLASGLILVLLIVITSSLFPYNSGLSPNKYIFRQNVNYTTGTSTVSLSSYSHVEDVVRTITTDEEWATRNTTTVLKTQTEVTFNTNLVPLYFADKQSAKKEMQYDFKRLSSASDKVQRVRATIQTQNSALCSVSVHGYNISSATLDTMTLSHSVEKLTVFRQKFGEQYTLDFEYEADQPALGRLTCYYDEWINGRNPAFLSIKEKMPDWTLLAIRGFGLANVEVDVEL